MGPIIIVLLILGTVTLGCAAIGLNAGRINLVALGLFFWILAVLIPAIAHF